MSAEIARYEGYVAKLMGDGVLAYFGWPRAHEDDAERAVRAGLAVVAAINVLKTPHGDALSARIGIATGLVVVGDLIGEGSAQEEAVVGEAPNLAARLQSLAEPNTVVASRSTQRLVAGLFETVDLGRQELKGFATPVRVWRIAGEAEWRAVLKHDTSCRRRWSGGPRNSKCSCDSGNAHAPVMGRWCFCQVSRVSESRA